MTLSLRFHVVQYIDDPFTAEGRNVAVLAHHNGKGYYRALGLNGNEVTPSYFKSLSPKARASYWAYREWVEWFRSLCTIREVELFDNAIVKLAANNFGLVATTEGVVELGDGYADISGAMDHLFNQLVHTPKISPVLLFEDQLEQVFNHSEIAYNRNFVNEIVNVEMISEANEVVTLEFSHLLTGNKPIGFKTLTLMGATQKSIAAQTRKITATFTDAIRTGYLQPDRCILLCGGVSEKHRDTLAQLSSTSIVMDIFEDSTSRDINRMLWANA